MTHEQRHDRLYDTLACSEFNLSPSAKLIRVIVAVSHAPPKCCHDVKVNCTVTYTSTALMVTNRAMTILYSALRKSDEKRYILLRGLIPNII